MEPLEKLRTQHIELLDHCNQLLELLDRQMTVQHAEQTFEELETISTNLAEHLRLEDDFLYPALQIRSQRPIRDTAKRFADTLGGLRQAYADYTGKWSTPEAISDSPADFCNQTRDITAALQVRIEKEERGLFPLLEEHRYSARDVTMWIEDWHCIRLQAADTHGGAIRLTAQEARKFAAALKQFAAHLTEYTS